jgi:predicted membrane protein
MEKIKVCYSGSRRGGLFFGLLLVVAGFLFFCFNCGFIPIAFKQVVFSWQMLLIVIGIYQLCKRRIFWGGLLLVIGLFFIVPRLAVAVPQLFPTLPDNFTSSYWPLLLIIAGLLLISDWSIRPRRKAQHIGGSCAKKHARYTYRESINNGKGFERNAVFGNGEFIVLDPVFQGGELNVVFGGITLDLRKTTLPEGDTFLEINSVFGGVTIIVPDDWYIVFNFDTVAGAMHDNRNKDVVRDESRRLVITGACVFGGGEIK